MRFGLFNGQVGSSVPILALMLLPFSGLGVRMAFERYLGERYRMLLRRNPSTVGGLIDFAGWVFTLAIAAALSAAIAMLLAGTALDPRGGGTAAGPARR